MTAFKQLLHGEVQRIEAALDQTFDRIRESVPEPLYSAMRYSIQAGGKRIRPVLCLACCRLFREDDACAMPVALAAELIHTYSLIHDDLPCMDNDDFRRGKPTNHKVFGDGMAVLAGDALLNLACEILLSSGLGTGALSGAACLMECVGCRGMIGGQCADLNNEKKRHADFDTLQYIHHHKTAKFIEGVCVAGARCADASEEDVAALREYGYHLGMAFQIIDDLLDVSGSREELGKDPDRDADKLTYPKLVGIERSRVYAQRHTEQAERCLDRFGDRAEYLGKLTEMLLIRSK